MKIYLAGPLFTAAERTFNQELAQLLQNGGHEVWSPQEEEPRDATAQAIFDADIEGVVWSDVVLACMDGTDPDSGTSFECGYAYHRRPIIAYRTDFRNSGDVGEAKYNLMLWCAAARHVQFPMGASIQVVADRLLDELSWL